MRDNIAEYGLLVFLALIWSTSFMLIKICVETIPPFTLTAARLVIAALLFLIYLGVKREWVPMHRQAMLLYFVSGVFSNSLPFVLISWGETHISSSLAAISMGIMPISTFVLAHFLVHDETMTKRKSLGVALGFTGLCVLVGLSALSGIGDHLIGTLSVLAGALSYSFAAIFVRLQPSFSRYKMAAGTTICAALISIPLAFMMENPLDVRPSREGLWSMVTLAVLPTALAAIIYFRIIKTLGATIFAQINYAIPILGGIWGILLLGETPNWNIFIALGLVLCGVYLIQTQSTVKAD